MSMKGSYFLVLLFVTLLFSQTHCQMDPFPIENQQQLLTQTEPLIKTIPNCFLFASASECLQCLQGYDKIKGGCFLKDANSIVGSLEGMNYKVIQINGNPPLNDNIKFSFTEGKVSIQGCNTLSASYDLNSDNGQISFGPFLSTLIACQNDEDQLVTSSLQNSAKVDQTSNRLEFLNKYLQKLLVLEKQFIKKDLTGTYIITIPNENFSSIKKLTLSSDSENFSISGGCNNHRFSYKADQNSGSISFGLISSTRKACPIDEDNVFLQAFLISVSFNQNQNGFDLVNDQGIALVKTTVKVEKKKYSGNLIAQYTIRLPKDNFHKSIRVQFAPTHIKVFGGCNFHTIRYYAYQDGSFEAILQTSTKKACQNDEDTQFINAIVAATKFAKNKDGVLLSNKNGDAAFLRDVKTEQTSVERYHYGLSAAFRQFDSSFVVRVEDPILIRITQLLISRYNHFLKKTRILAAFRSYKINHIRYQVLFKKIDKQDTFNAIVDYFPETDKLKLQSLVLMDLTILSVSDQGCALMENSNCIICSRGYKPFRGRCHIVQKQCLHYDPQECFQCEQGYILERGACKKDD